jgi:hypothetical protein
LRARLVQVRVARQRQLARRWVAHALIAIDEQRALVHAACVKESVADAS